LHLASRVDNLARMSSPIRPYRPCVLAAYLFFAPFALFAGCGGPPAIVIGLSETSGRSAGEDLDGYARQAALGAKGTLRIAPQRFTGTADADLLDMIDSGQVAGALLPVSALSSRVPLLSVFSTPYLFRDPAHLRKVIEGPLGTEILFEIAAGTDLIPIAFVWTGFHSIVTQDPDLRTPLRLKGKKAGVQNPESDGAFAEALGLSVTTTPPEKAAAALSSGAIDVFVGDPTFPPPDVTSGGSFVVLPTEHVSDPAVLVISSIVWKGLSIEEQSLLKDAKSVFRNHQESGPSGKTGEPALRTVEIDKKPFAAQCARTKRTDEENPADGILRKIVAVE
jgi:TRAP-type C4-dicarboxylate transport system substrate-binding protein